MGRTDRRVTTGPRAFVVAALAVGLAAGPGGGAAVSAAPSPAGQPTPARVAAPDPALAATAGAAQAVTLVTGDTVSVRHASTGGYSARVTHAAARPGGVSTSFSTLGTPDGGYYVIPNDAAAGIASGVLDRELFNVAYLADNGYGDAASGSLPVIAQYGGQLTARSLAPRADALPATTGVRPLASIDGAAMSLAKSDLSTFWATVAPAPAPAAPSSTSKTRARGAAPATATLRSGLTKLWLDRKAHATLDQSVPQIGAPQAWASGYTGKGVTVAVLDTGVDATHPDLAGRITAERSFVTGVDSVKDGHGHGTHVASTIVGSGAASGGKYKGVAPDASLIIGKVLDDSGFGSDSEIIAGMEWAAHSGATIISMSLGTEGPSDGSDPMSLAVNELTESTGALFVIAAGNSGPGKSTIGGPGAAADALTVAAVSKQDTLADFSSRGPIARSMALKPDIAGPGVDIVAARAAGTSIGTVVDDHYTTLSGTSMATPHVAGAAAILAQRHPDWTAGQLKAALMVSAKDDGYTSYEQGTGRVDVPHALDQAVLPDTASVDFGLVPETSEEPAERTLTITNHGDTEASVTATPAITGPDGAATDRVTVSPSSVSVPAGGSATLTIRFDPTGGSNGQYTGAITFDGSTPGSGARIAVAASRVPPNQVISLKATAPDNWPSPWYLAVFGAPWILMPVDHRDDFILAPSGLDEQVVVPEGTYAVSTSFSGYFDPRTGEPGGTVLLDPEVRVDRPGVEVSLDAHDARPVRVDTARPTHQDSTLFGVARGTAYGGRWVLSNPQGGEEGSLPWGIQGSALRISPTRPVTTGTLTSMAGFFASEPLVTLRLPARRGGRDLVFTPSYPDVPYGSSWTKKFELRGKVDVVDVGAGTPAELAGRDLRGRIALLSRPFDDLDSRLKNLNSGPAVEEMLAPLQAAGVRAAILFLDEGRPGWCALGGCAAVQTRQNTIPVLTLGPGEGAALRDALRSGSGRADIVAKRAADYDYVLRIPDGRGVVPATPTYRVDQRDLSAIRTRYHSDVPGYVEEVFSTTPTADGLNLFNSRFAPSPSESVQYIGPADPDTLWRRTVYNQKADSYDILDQLVVTPFEYYPRPTTRTVDYYATPAVPGAPLTPQSIVDRFSTDSLCAMCRSELIFAPLQMDTWTDRNGAYPVTGTAEAHLYRDGVEVEPSFPGAALWDMAGHPERARYRLTLSRVGQVTAMTHAARVDTAWEYTSQAPDKPAPKGYPCLDQRTTMCRVEPMLMLGYDLTDMIGLDNTAATPGLGRFTINAYHQVGAPDPKVRSMKLSVSYDQGRHWLPAPALTRDGHRFTATVIHPLRTPGAVSLRVTATDTAGNSVTQTVIDAYGLRTRGATDHGRTQATPA